MRERRGRDSMNTKQDPVSRHSADGWGVPRSHTVHWNDPLPTAAAGATMSGVEYLQAMLDGKLPRAPISALVGITAGEIQDGQVTFCCTPDESTYNPIGTVHGGLLCTLLDSVTACARAQHTSRGHGLLQPGDQGQLPAGGIRTPSLTFR